MSRTGSVMRSVMDPQNEETAKERIFTLKKKNQSIPHNDMNGRYHLNKVITCLICSHHLVHTKPCTPKILIISPSKDYLV